MCQDLALAELARFAHSESSQSSGTYWGTCDTYSTLLDLEAASVGGLLSLDNVLRKGAACALDNLQKLSRPAPRVRFLYGYYSLSVGSSAVRNGERLANYGAHLTGKSALAHELMDCEDGAPSPSISAPSTDGYGAWTLC